MNGEEEIGDEDRGILTLIAVVSNCLNLFK